MASKAQINANRQNAQKSTGPRTAEGKTAVSQNAVKHGLFAQSVIKGENEADYEAFHDKMVAEFKPVGSTEILLAERIVSLWWRLERAERIQNQAIDVMIERDEPSPLQKSLQHWMPNDIGPDTRGAGPELVLGRAIIKDYSNSRVLDRMLLYERRIESSLHKTMSELERLQLIRQYQQQEAEPEYEPAKKNTTVEKNSDLKKQSQFPVDHISVNSLKKRRYDNIPLCGAQENKANPSGLSMSMRNCRTSQSQNCASELTKGAGKREKPVQAAAG